jgi:hypothetical protein
MEVLHLNTYQTPLTTELKETLPREVWEEITELLSSVLFIKNITSPEEVRGFAKDRPKDKTGKIIVDLSNPHILEDMNFFRERALFHEKNKCYTLLRPNPNPKSEFGLFWKEEIRRWKEGLVRPSDGEWIPGYYYFYLNYCPIWLNEVVEDNGTKKKAERLRAFPKVWLGDYLFFHYFDQARTNGNHVKMLKTRGIGASFKFASITPCNMFTQSGLPNFHLASDKTFLEGEKGVFGKILDNLDWIGSETPFPRMRLINRLSDMEVQLGYLDEYGRRRGLKSSVFGISLKDNPDKARGVRGPLIHYEEDGLFKQLEKAWNVNRKAVEDGDNVYGILAAAGTGGVEGADFEGSEKLFRNPLAYNIYGIPNVFDKNQEGNVKCGFFWGAYLNRANCYDPVNGEPDVIKALIEILMDRYLVKYNSSDPMAITQKKAEECITPAEAVMRTTGTIFPVSELKDYLEDIKMQGVRFFDGHYVGDLVNNNGEIKWEVNANKYPIRTYRVPSDNLEGCLEIFEQPKLGKNNLPIQGRYGLAVDPITDDSGTSLGSILVFDFFLDTIVAEYTGRPKFANDFYEICRRLGLYYNGKILYENNLKGLYTYFSQQGCLYLLAANPEILKDQDMMRKGNYGNKSLGVHATAEINSYGRRLIRDWLLTIAHPNYQKTDDEGNIVGEVLNMHLIRSTALVEELIAWNADGNFDRVSALGILMILREEHKKFIDNYLDASNTTKSVVNDDYFTKNYDIKHGKGFSYEETQRLMKQYFSKP